MIISKTPFRVSLFGGSTDYKSFYSRFGSLLSGFSINKYTYISVRKTPAILDYKTRLAYSKTEIVDNHSDIKHDGIRGVLEYCKVLFGIDLIHVCDLPAQTGIGSSSSFIVGLLNSIYQIKGIEKSRKELATEAIFIERELLAEVGGVQDQIWAAYGGFNSIHIEKKGTFEVKPLPVSEEFKKDFVSRSVLIYTGKTRKSFKISNSHDRKENDDIRKRLLDLSHEAYDAFLKSDINEIGRLLGNAWETKKEISNLISKKHVELLHSKLKSDGMIGGKLIGSGGSGFIFGVMKEGFDPEEIKAKYSENYISFDIEEDGSKIINY